MRNSRFFSLRRLTYALALLALAGANTARADENQAITAALRFTREFAEKHHIAAAAEVRNRKNRTRKFQSDRVGDVERMRTDDGTFARKEGSEWVRSDDWGASGSPIDRHEAEELERLGGIVEGTLKTKDEPALRTWRVVEDAKHGHEGLITYEATRAGSGAATYPRLTFERKEGAKPEEALLQEINGPVFAGGEVVVAAIHLVYGSGLEKTELLPPSAVTSASPHP